MKIRIQRISNNVTLSIFGEEYWELIENGITKFKIPIEELEARLIGDFNIRGTITDISEFARIGGINFVHEQTLQIEADEIKGLDKMTVSTPIEVSDDFEGAEDVPNPLLWK